MVTSFAAVLSYTSAGWGLLDAIYMVIITLFGIGYGEVHPVVDPALKMQTMALIVVGCLSGLYSVGGFFQLVAEGEFNRLLRAQRMSRGIKRMNAHTIICGFGRVGRILAADLAERSIPFVVIDNDQARLDEAKLKGYRIVLGDATSEETLETAGAANAKALACVLPNDALNVFIALTARDLSDNLQIIARAEDPKTEHKLKQSGANHVILPSAIGAIRMAQIINDQDVSEANSAETNPISTSLRAVPVLADDPLAESTLSMARDLLYETGRVVGLQRAVEDAEIMTNFDDEAILNPGDILLLSVDG